MTSVLVLASSHTFGNPASLLSTWNFQILLSSMNFILPPLFQILRPFFYIPFFKPRLPGYWYRPQVNLEFVVLHGPFSHVSSLLHTYSVLYLHV